MEKLYDELSKMVIENSKKHKIVPMKEYYAFFSEKGYSKKEVATAMAKFMKEHSSGTSNVYD